MAAGTGVRASVPPRADFVAFPAEAIEQSITARFEAQVDRAPDRFAVHAGAEQLTYAELDAWANRIAGEILERRGVGPEPVALLLRQGAAAVAATLGVLKAGKIYVPLDPSHPPAGLARVCEWVGAGLVATESAHSGLAGDGVPVLIVDRLREGGGHGRPDVSVSPDDTANVFFTSGSTGTPKGVFDSHRNVLHNVGRYTNALALGPDDRLTLLQSCAFSGTVSSLFGALLNGAAVFPFDFAREGPAELARLLGRHELTVYHSVPSIFRSLSFGTAGFPAMRVIRLEGDRASSRDVELARRHFDPDCIVANGLGTTETGLCRQYLIDRDAQIEDGIVPVGHAVDGMEVVLLDESGAEVEPGERGEIAVRSRYLALGYWRRPDLTEASFRTDSDPLERTYRTGDLGRLRPDGCLEYLGRSDFRLKVRGNRVDVAEVESELIAVPGVRDALLTTSEQANGEAELVAYVVADGRPVDAADLSAALRRTLPGHLVPTRYHRLDELPVDASGKVDRRALPKLDPILTAGSPPRSALERHLAEIWEDVLGVAPVGVDRTFVELGGDSLSAATIAARIEADRPVPASLVESSTVASLAAALQSGTPGALVPLQPLGTGTPLFLVHDLNGEVARFTELARRLGDDRPVWGLRYTSAHETIEGMAAHYLRELRTVRPEGPYRLGGWCFGAVVAFELAHQLHAAGDEVALLALIGISAFDFPGLVAPGALERYRTTSGQQPARSVLSSARAMLRRKPPETPAAACSAAFARYVPAPFPGRATLVLSADETAAYSSDPAADWSGLCSDGVDVLRVPGGHDAILVEPDVSEVAGRLGG